MTEPKPAPVAAKRLSDLSRLENSLADLHAKIDFLTSQVAEFKARADEAEKFLSTPAVKAVRGVQKVWGGLK